VLTGLRESIQIAALGTAIAAVLALPFGALAARNLTRLPVLPYFGKVLLNVIRTFPELVLAIVFIRGVGPGAFAGVLAVGIHSIGMMGKLYAERIETVDKAALEALSASGATPLEVFRHGVLPEVLAGLSFVRAVPFRPERTLVHGARPGRRGRHRARCCNWSDSAAAIGPASARS
jgi:phosphonate transport system permease protein